ncbi:hypothetical protein BDR03DRAFT_954383 [Suillus americanus]|nr:hypothetical protein BDR03DRAFT_954383 [Suillus americanus]
MLTVIIDLYDDISHLMMLSHTSFVYVILALEAQVRHANCFRRTNRFVLTYGRW